MNVSSVTSGAYIAPPRPAPNAQSASAQAAKDADGDNDGSAAGEVESSTRANQPVPAKAAAPSASSANSAATSSNATSGDYQSFAANLQVALDQLQQAGSNVYVPPASADTAPSSNADALGALLDTSA